MEVPVSIFQESPLAGEPRERLFHIHSVHRYQLCAKYLYPSTLLWQMKLLQPLTTTWYDSLVLSFSLLKIQRRLIKHRSFLCALCLVLRSWWERFADGAVVCSTSPMVWLIMKHEIRARCRASRSVKQSSGLQKGYKFKFKYFIAWQGVYRGSCNKVSHTHTWKLN